MRQGFFGLVVFALGLNASGGCSVAIDVDGKQCSADADCTARDLGDMCVHNVCVRSQTGGPDAGPDDKKSDVPERFQCGADGSGSLSETVHYTFQVVEFVTRKAPEGLVVLACRNNDVVCADPSARYEDTNGTGLVELDLPFGFMGFFEVKSKVTLPALSYLTKPVLEDRRDRDLQVASAKTVEGLAAIANMPFDETKGIVMIEAFDCTRMPAEGVHFTEAKGGSTAFYLVNHVPNAEVTASVYDKDNNVADGGFLNVMPGYVTFSAYYGKDGPLLGEFNAAVRASTVTFIDMYF